MKRKMSLGFLALSVLFFAAMLSVSVLSGAEPGGKYSRVVNTGCTCSETIDPGCENFGWYGTAYCDGSSGTPCTSGINCIIIYTQNCNGKDQEDCNAPN